MDWLLDIWDGIVDGFSYIVSFEWLGDFWEFVTGMFSDLGEFSIGGLIFGICSTALIYFLRNYLLTPFTSHMGRITGIFWTVATYAACLVLGYLIGKKLFED